MSPLNILLSKIPKDCYTLHNEQTKTMSPHDKLQPGVHNRKSDLSVAFCQYAC
jgi:hypothetical protein